MADPENLTESLQELFTLTLTPEDEVKMPIKLAQGYNWTAASMTAPAMRLPPAMR